MPKYEKLRFLDSILSALYQSPNHTIQSNDINRQVYKLHLNEQDTDGSMFVGVADRAYELENALIYLRIEGYIHHHANDYVLQYKGIVKLDNGGFVAEAKGNHFKNLVNTYYWIISVIIAFVALIVTICKN